MSNKIYMVENMCTIYKLMFHKIQNALNSLGYENVYSPQDADVCLVGVCAAFDADEERSDRMIESVTSSGALVYVYGCLPSINPKKISLLVSYASWESLKLVRDLTGVRDFEWDDEAFPCDFRCKEDYRVKDSDKKFIGISTGCNFSCSYCPHVKGAGPMVSIPRDCILEQVGKLGGKTLVFTGTDTACYGWDIKTNFASLLGDVLGVAGSDVSIHISQFNPEGLFFDADTTLTMMHLFSDKRLRDVQMPIQTTSERLLRLMGRVYSPEKLEKFISSVKANNNSIFLRTDIMVGFPTETWDDVVQSVEYVCRNFSEVAVYAFEMKDVSPIYDMHLETIPQEEVSKRKNYAENMLRSSGLLVHSGGQNVETLMENDYIKELRRK